MLYNLKNINFISKNMFYNTEMKKKWLFLAKYLHIQKKSRIFAYQFGIQAKSRIAKSKQWEGDTAKNKQI